MSSANPAKRRPKRRSSNDPDRPYLQLQADVLELDYGSPARSRKLPNLSQGRDTEKEEMKVDIDEAMRRRRVANEETDEIVEMLKKKVDTSKERISALEDKVKDQEAEIEKLKGINNRLQTENNAEMLESKIFSLKRELEDKDAEIWGLKRANSRWKDLLQEEKANTKQITSEAKTLETEKAEQAKNYQALEGTISNLKQAIRDKEQLLSESSEQKTEINALTAGRQDLERDLDEANQKLSSAVENGKSLQLELIGEITRAQELQEEKRALNSELEKKEKLLDTLRKSIRAIRAFTNDERL
ncbi:uncharacterized protein EAF01_009982 [Botrytis porri]|nr:uncharacterized protein EAF01_009982 [Botrytis porri]KAF7894531.1 hypothetical protein EAF01_009982 [Botrytis porri]